MMNIAVISDVHGNYKALKCVIDDIKNKKINSVIVLGDIIFSGNEPQKCFDTIKKLKPLVWIKGNTDNMNELIHRLECDILLCGHTHLPYIAFSHGKLIMNVGSVGLPKDEPKASYGILRFDGDNFEYSIRKISIN